VQGQENKKLLASFDLNNEYGDVKLYNTIGELNRIKEGFQNLDSTSFADEGSAVLRYVIETDVFNSNQPLVNSVEYFFSVTSLSVNRGFVVNQPADTLSPPDTIYFLNPDLNTLIEDDWIASSSGDVLENSLSSNFIRVVPGSDEVRPFRSLVGDEIEYTGTRPFHDGFVAVDAVDRDSLTGDAYSISFFDNGNKWILLNEGSGDKDTLTFQAMSTDEWNFPIVDGLSIRVINAPDHPNSSEVVVDTVTDRNRIAWVDGSGKFAAQRGQEEFETSVLNGGIDFVKNAVNADINTTSNHFSSTIARDRYFPVKVVIDTVDIAMAEHFFNNYSQRHPQVPVKPVNIAAYDISDSTQPRQLNIVFNSPFPKGFIDFLDGGSREFIVCDSDYDETGRYAAGVGDSLFKAEAFMVFDLTTINPVEIGLPVATPKDSLNLANPLEIRVTPHYPNSDADEFRFDTQFLNPTLTSAERKDLLDKIKVVPNPYFAYSIYETSYDTPVLKFTHLDEEVTIRIFNLAGQLVQTLTEQDKDYIEANEIKWDMRNHAGLKIASGMYIAHIEVPGVGAKVLKFAVIQREERIDQY
jgi:hypothetical protein